MTRERSKRYLTYFAIYLLGIVVVCGLIAHEPFDALFALAVGLHYVKELL